MYHSNIAHESKFNSLSRSQFCGLGDAALMHSSTQHQIIFPSLRIGDTVSLSAYIRCGFYLLT